MPDCYAFSQIHHARESNYAIVNEKLRKLRETLYSADTGLRFGQVEQACSQTFEWLWENPKLQFKSWLESGSNCYFIKGCPGSGKSTLMKWLYNDPRTAKALRLDAKKNTMANFFF